MLKSAVLLFSTNSAASLMLLMRNLLFARSVSLLDYGIASTFGIVTSMIEMATNMSLTQQIVQSERGDEPKFQATLQAFQVARGLVASLAIFLGAGFLADLFGAEEAIAGYRWLALVPLTMSLVHFDIYRMNRAMRFGPLMKCSALTTLTAIGSIGPLLLIFGDWRAMLASTLLQSMTTAGASHMLAERPYRLAYDREIIADSIQFGWPLLMANLLLFAIMQGDKTIVGTQLGLETLAIFSMGMTLTLTPTLVVTRTLQSLFIPRLSKLRDVPEMFDTLNAVIFQLTVLIGLGTVIVVHLAGEPVVRLLLGETYATLPPLLTLIAVSAALGMIRSVPHGTFIALATTRDTLFSNLARVVALPITFLAALGSGDLRLVICCIAIGELTGMIATIALLLKRTGLQRKELARPAGTALLGFAFLAVQGSADTGLSGIAQCVVLVALIALCLATSSLLIRFLMHSNPFRRPVL